MIPAPFDYKAPVSVEEVRKLLAQHAGAKLLAGGMSLLPALKHRLLTPPLLIDLAAIPGLDAIEDRRGRIRIGARTTHRDLAAAPALEKHPIFREAALQIGDRQVQNRGTLGGSLVHADPAADWPAVFLALDGEAVVQGETGERKIPARDFFTGLFASAVGAEEIVTALHFVTETRRAGSAYLKLRQPASGFALVGAAVALCVDRKGRAERVAIGLTGINPVPFRAASVERRLTGQPLDAETLAQVCTEIDEAEPMDDPNASADYRAHLASVYTRRALALAAARASA